MMGDRGRIIICSSQKDREESYDYFSSILLFFWIQVTDGGRTVGYVIPKQIEKWCEVYDQYYIYLRVM